MKKIIIIIVLLIAFSGISYAEQNSDCLRKCLAYSNNKNIESTDYCTAKCSKQQVPYEDRSIEIQKQTLGIQKQQLELQKQQLELQKQQLQLQRQEQKQDQEDKD